MKIEVLETNLIDDEMGLGYNTGVQLATETVKTLRVDGYPVPHLTVYEYPENPDMVSVVVDHRLAYDIPKELLATVGRLTANAMALAAGRTSFGENSNIKNDYGKALAGYPTQEILGTPVQDDDFEA